MRGLGIEGWDGDLRDRALRRAVGGAGDGRIRLQPARRAVQRPGRDAGNPLDDPMQTQAGSHPFALTTLFRAQLPETEPESFESLPDEKLKDLFFELVAGFSGDATAIPRCSSADFSQ